ncbi:MAG: phosphate acyltransferase PlsX [Frisingicoccus sp.]|uniref:phosphate acyltransferase PlsX n=1 Tax=Frisingicoccus sp. TaxID=1918627 RepID=UPI0025BCF951|nr:phosphate acyltransferase PlsX [Frisingicoccus sp.]MDY4835337.1 phosphate acyltransferase PlsX [Frisingicoccus sp.]MDY5955715.1 phosphate acyltransferase PlsX [Frisingicoccus sp.]
MEELVTVALDAMGGDYAPVETVKGGVDAVNASKEIKVLMVGDEEKIRKELAKYTYDQERIEVVGATEVIDNNEPPVQAIRNKKDSSLVRCQRLVKQGEADAMVSAGSTGAVLAGGQLIVGRIKGVHRPPLAPLIPTEKGFSMLIDCGANVDARAAHLLQFAKIGTLYMRHIMGIENPKVAIVNIGTEEEKGNQLVKEAYPLLRECSSINFIGSIEARNIPAGEADVIVCEAFVGNVILKLYEGVAMTLVHKLKASLNASFRGKVGGLLVKPAVKTMMKEFDATEYGGAPLLGLKGLVVKSHGSSNAYEIQNSILQCISFKKQNINVRIEEALNQSDQ